MKRVTILNIDYPRLPIESLRVAGIECTELFGPEPSGGAFVLSDERYAWLLSVFAQYESDEIDLIVLGNNMGVGLSVGEMIPLPLREKTIVMRLSRWLDEEREPYQKLGYSRFGQKMSALEHIKDFFEQ